MSSGFLAIVAIEDAHAASVDRSTRDLAVNSESVLKSPRVENFWSCVRVGAKKAGNFAGFVKDGIVGKGIKILLQNIAAIHEQSNIVDEGGFSLFQIPYPSTGRRISQISSHTSPVGPANEFGCFASPRIEMYASLYKNDISRPQPTHMGCREFSMRLTAIRKLCGHPSSGPSEVLDQSFSRMSHAISPSPATQLGGGGGTAPISVFGASADVRYI